MPLPIRWLISVIRCYEYIPGPGLLAEHDLAAGADSYMQNLIAVKESHLESLKETAGCMMNRSHPQKQTAISGKQNCQNSLGRLL